MTNKRDPLYWRQLPAHKLFIEAVRAWSAVVVLLIAWIVGLVSRWAALRLVKVAEWVRGSR